MMYAQDVMEPALARPKWSCTVASRSSHVPLLARHNGARRSLMAGPIELGELYPTSHERQAMDGRCGVKWCSETRLVRNVRKDQICGT